MEQCFGAKAGKHDVFAATIVPRLSHAATFARRENEKKRSKIESQCFGGIAEKFEVLVSGINTLVRLAEQVFRSDRREAVSRKGAVTGRL
jgi:hypothetical protein